MQTFSGMMQKFLFLPKVMMLTFLQMVYYG